MLCKYGWKHLQSLPGRVSKAHSPAAAKVYASARGGRHSVSIWESRRIGMTRSTAYQCEHKLQYSLTGLPWQHCMVRMYLIRYRYSRQLGICQFHTHVSAFAQGLTWVIHWGCQVRKMLKGSFEHLVGRFTQDYTPMIHENRMQPGFQLNLFPRIVQGVLPLGVHR